MAEFTAHVLICTNSEGAADRRHCGDKGGQAVFQAFREVRAKHGKEREILVNRTGCTGQHSHNSSEQATVIVYGPDPTKGGVWYKVTPGDVEELFREHLLNGNIVERQVNSAMCVNYQRSR